MSLLLDSNAFLWWMEGGQHLAPEARRAISDTIRVAVSVVTAWELEIKRQSGRLDIADSAWLDLSHGPFEMLSIDLADVLAAARLPLHHRDPFDRMIIAQASNRGLTIVTRDAAFDRYGVATLLA